MTVKKTIGKGEKCQAKVTKNLSALESHKHPIAKNLKKSIEANSKLLDDIVEKVKAALNGGKSEKETSKLMNSLSCQITTTNTDIDIAEKL